MGNHKRYATKSVRMVKITGAYEFIEGAALCSKVGKLDMIPVLLERESACLVDK
ncbi:hypothetical protein [Enterocloster clostridioformis]|uniref:hypothetical protein n=1 Tax=Enterocloster clostridioformis TaxID=1531 RepID=UPI000B118482